jgi:hypothetical protein
MGSEIGDSFNNIDPELSCILKTISDHDAGASFLRVETLTSNGPSPIS